MVKKNANYLIPNQEACELTSNMCNLMQTRKIIIFIVLDQEFKTFIILETNSLGLVCNVLDLFVHSTI